MRKILVATTLLALVAGPVAIAQTGDRSTNSATDKQGPWPAPVGHRQPRVDQVPPEKDLSSPSNPSTLPMKVDDVTEKYVWSSS